MLTDLACPTNDLLIGRMIERDRIGLERYGTRLQPHNGRDAHGDALDEVLDLIAYLKQAGYESNDSRYRPAMMIAYGLAEMLIEMRKVS